MPSKADIEIIQFLQRSDGKASQKDVIQSMRALFNDGHIYRRIRHLEARGLLVIERTGSDIIITLPPEVIL